MDFSYNIVDEWETVKDAVNKMNSSLVGKYGIDTRVFIVPFSDRSDEGSPRLHNNSIKGVYARNWIL